jgi:hypothetical protein
MDLKTDPVKDFSERILTLDCFIDCPVMSRFETYSLSHFFVLLCEEL